MEPFKPEVELMESKTREYLNHREFVYADIYELYWKEEGKDTSVTSIDICKIGSEIVCAKRKRDDGSDIWEIRIPISEPQDGNSMGIFFEHCKTEKFHWLNDADAMKKTKSNPIDIQSIYAEIAGLFSLFDPPPLNLKKEYPSSPNISGNIEYDQRQRLFILRIQKKRRS